jgi:hypothetical protein
MKIHLDTWGMKGMGLSGIYFAHFVYIWIIYSKSYVPRVVTQMRMSGVAMLPGHL